VIFVVFLQLGFFVEKQFLDRPTLELSIYDKGEYHALAFPCQRDGSGWRDVRANRPMPLEPTHWRLWDRKRA
jgi:hypothetical protein